MNKIKQAVKSILIRLCKRMGETSPLLLDFTKIDDHKTASYLLDMMRSARFLEPKTVTAPANKKILVIAPHPDDEVIGMGGVLSQMLENGCEVSVVSLTFGGDKNAVSEAERAAKFLNYKFVHFFDFVTKAIALDKQTIGKFCEIYQSVDPDVLFLPFMLDDHDDHRRASELLLKAFESELDSKTKMEVWAYQVYTALPLNAAVNISNVIEKKIEAISQYKSRFSQRDWAHFAKGLSAFNVRFLAGNKTADYAEVFHCSNVQNYLKMCKTYFRDSQSNCYNSDFYKDQ